MPFQKRRKSQLSLNRRKRTRKENEDKESSSSFLPYSEDMSINDHEPIYHSTPVKCCSVNPNSGSRSNETLQDASNLVLSDSETVLSGKSDNDVNLDDNDGQDALILCHACETPLYTKTLCSRGNTSGLLCSYCGKYNSFEIDLVESLLCHHSIISHSQMCDKCGFRPVETSEHIHACHHDRQICELCGAGASYFINKSHDRSTTVAPTTSTGPSSNQDVKHDEIHNILTDEYREEKKEEEDKQEQDFITLLTTTVYKSKSLINSDHESQVHQLIMEIIAAVSNGSLDTESLTYSVMFDTVKALNSQSLTEMRFSTKSKLFWKTFVNKFGAAPLRMLSGWKHTGSILHDKSSRGHLSGENADIILAIPSEEVLKKFDPYVGGWPKTIPPGICHAIVDRVAQSSSESGICIALDGKRIAPGLKGDKGDINLLGQEEDLGVLTPSQQREEYKDIIASIEELQDILGMKSNTPVNNMQVATRIRTLLTTLTEKNSTTKINLHKKKYALEKLKTKSEQSEDNKTKLQYPISLITANILQLVEIQTTGNTLRDNLARLCAELLNGEVLWPTLMAVDISQCARYHALHDIDLLAASHDVEMQQLYQCIINEGLHVVKQRSVAWFQQRKQVKVTGSRLHYALGCAGLKEQQEHYRTMMLGFEAPAPSQAAKEAMEWGTIHEICAVATLATKFLPVYYPECCLLEVGGYKVNLGDVDIIISPDGHLINNTDNTRVAALEIKCPKNQMIPETIPARYYLQVQAEIMTDESFNYCIFCVWTEDTTKIFRINKDKEIWPLIYAELNSVYGCHPKCPTRLSQSSKLLKEKIKIGVKTNCKVICELKSVHACIFNGVGDQVSTTSMNNNFSAYTTEVCHEALFKCTENTGEICSRLSEKLEEVIHYLKHHHQLSRRKATEVVTFVASELDRLWSQDQTYGAPVCYFLKGYSLTNDIVRNILEDVLDACHERGIHCPVQSFDGQYLSLLQSSFDGQPQTLLQLQKTYWAKVQSMTKTELLAEIKQANTTKSLCDIDIVKQSNGVIVVGRKEPGILPQSAVKFIHVMKNTDAVMNTHDPSSADHTTLNMPEMDNILVDVPQRVIESEDESIQSYFRTTISEGNDGEDNVVYEEHLSSNNSGKIHAVDDNGRVDNRNNYDDDDCDDNVDDGGGSCNDDGDDDGGEDVGMHADIDNDGVTMPVCRIDEYASDSVHVHVSSTLPQDKVTLSGSDKEKLLALLKDTISRWSSLTVNDLMTTLKSCEDVSHLTVMELKVMLKFLKVEKNLPVILSGRKQSLVRQITSLLMLPGEIPAQRLRKQSPQKLSALAFKAINTPKYRKVAVCVSYATWKFPEVVKKWKETSRIRHGMVISGLEKYGKIDWFYTPEFSSKRNCLQVRKIDPHHLLTRHRSALCKRDIGYAKRNNFLEVAADNSTPLKIGMLEDSLNMQSTDYARITFSSEVEEALKEKGYCSSANLCKNIREWFQAADEPGISAMERCQMKMRYRSMLIEMANLQSFPPPGMFIKGYPKALWESTIASIDADIILYGISKRGTYNQRAVSSQPCEGLYSSLATLPGSRNGVPNCTDLETNMAKICGEIVVRYDPNRGFPLRMSSAPVYPQHQLESDVGPLPQPKVVPSYVNQIQLVNHLFDSKNRKRRARHKPIGISNLDEPAKGVQGVRQYHKLNEGRLNALIRLGKSSGN